MTGLLALSLIAVAVARVRGGSLVGWTQVNVSWWFLALGSLGLQLILYNPPLDRQPWALAFGPPAWLACLAALLAVLVRNAYLNAVTRGAWTLAAIGVGLNVLVVVANHGFMPQSADARTATRGGQAESLQVDSPRLSNVVKMSDQTQLNALGDVIPEPAWLPKTNVISVGDLLLGLGLAWWAFSTTMVRSNEVR